MEYPSVEEEMNESPLFPDSAMLGEPFATDPSIEFTGQQPEQPFVGSEDEIGFSSPLPLHSDVESPGDNLNIVVKQDPEATWQAQAPDSCQQQAALLQQEAPLFIGAAAASGSSQSTQMSIAGDQSSSSSPASTTSEEAPTTSSNKRLLNQALPAVSSSLNKTAPIIEAVKRKRVKREGPSIKGASPSDDSSSSSSSPTTETALLDDIISDTAALDNLPESAIVKIGEIRLPRDSLQRISSSEVQELIKRSSAQPNLTASDQKELKKLKRLVKNRESAQLSRQRKRDYVDKLEGTIKEIAMSQHLLRTENTALHQYIQQLQSQLQQANISYPPEPHPTAPFPCPTPAELLQQALHANESAEQQQQQQSQQSQQQQQQPPRPTQTRTPLMSQRNGRNLKAAGVLLLVVLFSFGIFLNTPEGNQLAGLQPIANPGRVVGVFSTQHQPQPAARTLLEVTPVSPPATALVRSVHNNLQHQQLIESPLSSIEAKVNTEWTPKNMSYLVCNDVTRFDPPEDQSGSTTLGFMVPYSAVLENSSGAMLEGDDMIEFTCNVVGINIIPRRVLASRT